MPAEGYQKPEALSDNHGNMFNTLQNTTSS